MDENSKPVIIPIVYGVSILIFMAVTLLIASLGFIFSISISKTYLFFVVLIWSASWLLSVKRYLQHVPAKVIVLLVASQLLLMAAGTYLCGQVYDLSFDGQWYHQEAIYRLKNGWNPLQDYYSEEIYSTELIVSSYPKGAWIIASTLYKITGFIEYSKIFNFMLILAAFALVYAALLTFHQLTTWQRIALALVTALNPVSLYQIFSFYVDGQLASLLICIVCLLYLTFKNRNGITIIGLLSGILLIVNVKFTAWLYLFAIVAGFNLWIVIYTKTAYKALYLITLVITGSLLGIAAGINPYLTNTIAYHHPFFPAVSTEINIMNNNRPANFTHLNRIERMGFSLFAKSQNAYGPVKARLKIPFSLSSDPLEFNSYDIRLGGFGPWFSGALLLTGAIIILSWLLREKPDMIIYASLIVFASALTTSEGWWARYAPQIWWLPLTGLLFAFLSSHQWLRFTGIVLLAVLAINLTFVATRHYSFVRESNQSVHEKLEYLAQQSSPIEIEFGIFRSEKLWVAHDQISYFETTAPECPQPIVFTYPFPYGAIICTTSN